MKLYFVRHGQTEANAQQVYDGQRLNAPLTELGRNQAAAVGIKLRTLDIGQIISSPLIRTRQTADIIAENMGNKPSIIFDDRLMEHDNGALSGTPYRTVSIEELAATTDNEPTEVFRARVSAALLDASSSTLNTLVVSHGGVYTQYLTLRDGLPAEQYWSLPDPQNGQVEELTTNWQ